MLLFIRLILPICDWSPLPMMPPHSIHSLLDSLEWSLWVGCLELVWLHSIVGGLIRFYPIFAVSHSLPAHLRRPFPGFHFRVPSFLGSDFYLHLLHLYSLDSWMWLRRILSGVQTNIKLMIFTNNPMSPYVGWKSFCMLLSKTSSFQLIQP